MKDINDSIRLILFFSIFLSLIFPFEGNSSLKKIKVEDGILYFEDNTKVNLFGFNFQPCLSWEHGARMHNQGVLMPLKARDLKKVTDESFDEIERLGAELIRVHLMPADFTNDKGDVFDTIWLDTFMYVMAEAQKRGLYVYLTILNHLDHDGTQFPYNKESFAASFPREDWMVDPDVIMATENCIKQLLNHRNPYNGELLKFHSSLAVIEPINEPSYWWFEKWVDFNKKGNRDKFESWSYQNTKKYINRIVDLIRSEGVTQPIVWNCGWPKLIQKNKAAFNAIADSKVDGVSFCLYPGQSDLKKPFWKNTEELSDKNYLPYIKDCAENEDWLGWLYSDSFKNKAKLVYEYETFCNQSGYLYPAMAEFFRSVDAQIAAQWTYGLTGYAKYLGGSHVFNLKTTPKKAASFMVAKKQFKDIQTSYSYKTRSSAVMHDGELIYSGEINIESELLPSAIIGVGNSPYVEYSGSGLYFIEPDNNGSFYIEIMPDVKFLNPHWKELHTGDAVVALAENTSNIFTLKLPGLDDSWVYRKEGHRWELISKSINFPSFKAKPGKYIIEKNKLNIDRKLLKEGWGK